ncbi:MAG TPA: hypothetical protein DDZ51_13795 [Planctomycetaceae bacterium]|nr:hypothetical protein [Planctomycetaceae bacterium]
MSISEIQRNLNEIDLRREFAGSRFLMVHGQYYFGGAVRQAVLLAWGLVKDCGCNVDFLGWGGDGILFDEVRAVGCRNQLDLCELGRV